MTQENRNYVGLILLHVIIGALSYFVPVFAKIFVGLVFIISVYYIIKDRNIGNEVLIAAAYQAGAEVFFRMTHGVPSYEFSKYMIIIFMFIGIYYNGISKNAIVFWIFLILLIPGILISTQTFSLDNLDLRKTIVFNLSGPTCLGVCSLYCYFREISFKMLNKVLLFLLLPIISTLTYLIIYTPAELSEILLNTSSNFNTSGGFGPNQVSTMLGLGMFIIFSRIIFESKTIFIFIFNVTILLIMSYRAIITFSRGGVITGLIMMLVLFLITYLLVNGKSKVRLIHLFGVVIFISISLWSYSVIQTGGLIEKRYQNKDALGRVKESNFSGREKIADGEMDLFFENPFFGTGVGRATDIRNVSTGEITASHNEITRMLAEHGTLGIINLFILIFTPLFLYLDNKKNVFILSFLLFWFLTINHAAMRTASPAFIYALSLLKVKIDED